MRHEAAWRARSKHGWLLAPIVFDWLTTAQSIRATQVRRGGELSLLIVSEQFLGLPRLARHRAVLDRVATSSLIPCMRLRYAPTPRRISFLTGCMQ
jgi:hypothetical protein